MDREDILNLLLEVVKAAAPSEEERDDTCIPVGISNRHIHLSQSDLDILFGAGYQLTKVKELSQPGQYSCKETLTICGPKGAIEKVRILGPVRSKTQVEVLLGDCIKMGILPQTRLSGDLCGTPGITLIGPNGSVQIREGVIVAQRHIHMTTQDAQRFGVYDGQIVSIQSDGPRGGTYHNVAIRANGDSSLECHIDIEEANAMNINSRSKIIII
jgi:Propanediol utilization protein